MFPTRATPCPPCRALAAGGCLLLLLWLAWTPPAQAAPDSGGVSVAATTPEPLFARFSLSGFFAGFANRTRVVQLCVVTMIVALAILMKKFADVEPGFERRKKEG